MRVNLALVLCVVAAIVCGRSVQADPSQSLGLVPKPQQMERKAGDFQLKKDTAVLVEKGSADAVKVGKQLADRLSRKAGINGMPMPSEETSEVRNAILLTTKNAKAALGAEGYTLDVTPGGVVIRANGGAGLFYGVQTLLQLFPPEIFSPTKSAKAVAWQIPAVKIEDQPRFPWRGLMLDVSRHFFTKDEVKNYIDVMAQQKLNILHFHLVDDQGWRIEIKRYPKLTEIGAWRAGVGFGFKPKDTTAYGKDGRYGGFYTQDDIRDLVAYAKDRYVTIVPEIEMPGHSTAALAAYPQYSCTGLNHKGAPYTTECPPGIQNGIYCAGNDGAFEFTQNVLAEVIDLFPGKYIHIGADEVPKDNWKKCPKCQARMKAEGLKNEEELQSYFVRRTEKFINSHNRTLMGWDEILEGGLAPNAAVMNWRDFKDAVAAANAGHDVVVTLTSHCYFDYSQAPNGKGEPKSIGGYLPLKKVYWMDPVPAALAPEKAKHILGAGGNVWSEFIPNYPQVQYMTYPRACALAEVVWTNLQLRDWDDFRSRLDPHLMRLKAQGVNYRRPKPTDDAPANRKDVEKK